MSDFELQRIDESCILKIGNEIIRITDYEIKSSASGKTELIVKIIMDCRIVEFLANGCQKPAEN